MGGATRAGTAIAAVLVCSGLPRLTSSGLNCHDGIRYKHEHGLVLHLLLMPMSFNFILVTNLLAYGKSRNKGRPAPTSDRQPWQVQNDAPGTW